ncbi:FadR/GntR family transcriptional regulator [Piscinibacter terrae]|uniref:FadR family transcriptional regulator n=1 Tax=Piscinibacter terrae TaxID=2496871 RepID=A0A3N7HMX7_9BURK|nr:FadR/GntR family transcriptional regulator [Albitalea terrae]RQP22001.1 FadR family transcriptional regulator [Albitalea terrae]
MESPNLPPSQPKPARRPKSLALGLVEAVGGRIRDGQMRPGDKLPTEAAIMEEFGVSRTVVREALSKLQAAGLVETRHGVGTFVVGTGDTANFRIAPEQIATAKEVIAVLELRIGLETEAAGLAAVRRSDANLLAMRGALATFSKAINEDGDALAPDFQFHLEIARATQNVHFLELMNYLGTMIIPRARLNTARVAGESRKEYLRRVNTEHENIVSAIANQDPEGARAAMRTHLANSRERLRRAHEAAGR